MLRDGWMLVKHDCSSPVLELPGTMVHVMGSATKTIPKTASHPEWCSSRAPALSPHPPGSSWLSQSVDAQVSSFKRWRFGWHLLLLTCHGVGEIGGYCGTCKNWWGFWTLGGGVWLHLWHEDVSRQGIQSQPQLRPTPQLHQGLVLNPWHHSGHPHCWLFLISLQSQFICTNSAWQCLVWCIYNCSCL